MTKSDTVIVFNSFKEMARAVTEEGANVVAETANAIEADVKSRWDGMAKLPVRVRWSKSWDSGYGTSNKKAIVAYVVAGSTKKFFAVFAEYGTRYWPGRPAMVPAAERHRQSFISKAKRLDEVLRSIGR